MRARVIPIYWPLPLGDAPVLVMDSFFCLHREATSLRLEILKDESEWKDEWRTQIDEWRQKVGQFIREQISPAKATYVDSIHGLKDVQMFNAVTGRSLPRRKGNLVQELEERLRKFGEFMKDY